MIQCKYDEKRFSGTNNNIIILIYRKEKAYRRLHESVHLPALKPRLSTLFSERHKRSVSLQRNKVTGCL